MYAQPPGVHLFSFLAFLLGFPFFRMQNIWNFQRAIFAHCFWGGNALSSASDIVQTQKFYNSKNEKRGKFSEI